MPDRSASSAAEGTRPIFGIGAVARMLDMAPATLRTWEDRYDVVSPERSEGGRRLYTREQIEQLRFVTARVAEGISPADAHRLLAERLAGGGLGPSPAKRPTGTPVLVLVAERDPYAADMTEHFLRAEGYEVAVAFDVADARRRAELRVPRVAIVELLLSDGSGAELCRLLKERGVLSVVAVSSLAAREEAFAAGADAFLAKPLDPRELVSTVQDLLGAGAPAATAESAA